MRRDLLNDLRAKFVAARQVEQKAKHAIPGREHPSRLRTVVLMEPSAHTWPRFTSHGELSVSVLAAVEGGNFCGRFSRAYCREMSFFAAEASSGKAQNSSQEGKGGRAVLRISTVLGKRR
jgi:hypothetical protein